MACGAAQSPPAVVFTQNLTLNIISGVGGSQVWGGAARSLRPPVTHLVPWSRLDRCSIIFELVSDEERGMENKLLTVAAVVVCGQVSVCGEGGGLR